MTRILAVADEVDEALYEDALHELKPDLILSAGDLPFDYLENLVTRAGVPLLYVPGNHDPDVKFRRQTYGPVVVEEPIPGPQGCDNVDGKIFEVDGLRIAGLGGSLRYREGPNQYTQRGMRRRALGLELRARLRRRRPDILLTHAPPQGCGDGEDLPHQGFAAFHRLASVLRPRYLVHGHLHPYGRKREDRRLGETLVVNAVPHRLLEIGP
ncbi:MAG TPA: metallophosphoesterase [Candidatus Dormibacteraeota bacterium]